MNDSIFRLVTPEDLKTAQETGMVPRSGADEKSGFVHMSPRSEVLATAQRYYSVEDPPFVLEIDPNALGSKLKWEAVASRGGVEFPHLYAPNIPFVAVRYVSRLTVNDQGELAWDAPHA